MPDLIANNEEKNLLAGDPMKEDARWQLVKRISVSAAFVRSPRLAHLLLYLGEQAILNRKYLLTEQSLASAVFDRKTNFDPAADTIVRSQMVRLRQRLEDYFRDEGHAEHLRVSIPKGGYVPVFEAVPLAPAKEQPEPLTEPPPIPDEPQFKTAADTEAPRRTIRRLRFTCIALLGFSLALCLLLFIRRSAPLVEGRRESPAAHRFWKKLFDENQKTTIVAADSGIVMLHGGTGQNTNLSEYLSRNFSRELAVVSAERQKELLFDASRRYTSFVDLELIERLSHLPEAVSSNYNIRFARDITADDLKQGNVILSGSQDANPWIELFEPEMNFVLNIDLTHGLHGFTNRNPQPGERPFYSATQAEYGVLAFLPNLSRNGNVLIVEGTSVAGTEAISDFLFMDSNLEPFLRKITRKDGSIPKFEILLESKSLNGSASRSRIVAYRTYG
ncbi:hypothetical protein [Granulicella sp. S156]|jgi:hypothetical protein|uniref:hypothetical protein n=1 Tax=Granulicella sp. S156 TaxID=1747224 RepID=UPI00131BCD15|nr:hypothetical protein [Granulicella sp. S156]